MMSTMIPVRAGSLAYLDRPDTTPLVVAALAIILGWALHAWAEHSTRPPSVHPESDSRPTALDGGALEPPAIVALITNDYAVPHTAVTATTLDLAARGWIKFSTVDGELVVITSGTGEAGDALRPFEQQVLNHLTSRAFNDMTSAGTLAASHHRLDRRWWMRFDRSVAASSIELGLGRRRYTAIETAPASACAVIGLIAIWMSISNGTEIAVVDSWQSRALWFVALAAAFHLIWHTAERIIGSAQRPTEKGEIRTTAWMGYRSRLRDRIPGNASVIASPAQQVALAEASVMGVAEHVLNELPVAPEGNKTAWSEAGGSPHVVSVRYPIRPGYGQHPLKVGVAGVVVYFVSQWLRGFFTRVSEGDALESLIDRVPGQIDLIQKIAEALSIVCWIPIIWAVWAVVAGAIDSVATRERVGVVVRARRPAEVVPGLISRVFKPFADHGRFSTYVAVDDGRRHSVTSWLASERTAVPQGAQARVRATPLLGYVRSSEPVGTTTAPNGIVRPTAP